MDVVNNIVEYLTQLLQNGGIIYGVLLILLESIIPALPLGVFVALNINAYGLIIGILISWLSTCLGCYASFLLFTFISNKLIKNRLDIAAGVVRMGKRKFLIALLMGKIFMVTFWGCVGKSLLESITDIKTIIIVAILILLAYFLSKFVSKKMKIE